MKISYLSPAYQKLVKAVEYFDMKSYGSGERFLNAVQKAESLAFKKAAVSFASFNRSSTRSFLMCSQLKGDRIQRTLTM